MRTRVVFSNYDDLRNPYYAGGGSIAIHEVSKRLAAIYDVSVICGKYPGCRDGPVEGVNYKHVGSGTLGPKFGQLLFHFALPRLARANNYEVWIESLTPPFSTACLQLFTKKPVALLTQNLIGKAMAKKYKLPFHWAEHLGLKTYRHGIALSDPLRSELLAANPRMSVAVIPNGVDPALIHQKVEHRGEHILFLGRIDIEQKGLDLLLLAFQRIAGTSALPLVLAGSGIGREENALRKRIQQLGLADRVRLLGKVSGEQKAEAFRKAVLLAMPSRYEGFPLTLLEAFCFELPAVLFAIPELNWLPEECCVKVTPFDVAAFGAALANLAEEEVRRTRMGKAAKAWVETFGWDTIAAKYDNFFATLLAH